MRRSTVVLAAIVSIACEGAPADLDGGRDAGEPVGAEARYRIGDVLDWADVPFPHDLFRAEDGSLRLPALPSDRPMWETVRARLELRGGFCTTCGIVFPIDGELDRASLPADSRPGDVAGAADPIVLVDTVEGSFVPLRFEWNDADGLVAIDLARGHVLAPNRRYVAALTSALRGADGEPLRAAPDFVALRDESSGGDPALERARAVVAPALDALATAGVARDSVVSVAVFTTGEPTQDLLSIRAMVDALPAPSVVSVDAVWHRADGTLDELLGVPTDDLPGPRPPATPGVEGEDAFSHGPTLLVVRGAFEAPRIMERSAPLSGYPLRDGDGSLIASGTERVPFLLIVPDVPDLSSLPVLVSHPGGGGDMTGAAGLCETAGRTGAAVIGFDPVLHGSRGEGAVEEGASLRDNGEPDGFLGPPGAPITPVVTMLGLMGAEEGREGSPLYATGAYLQMVSDALVLIRLLREGDWTAVADAHADLADLGFAADQVGWTGISQGGVIGSLVLTVSDGLAAASGTPNSGHLVDILAVSPTFEEALASFSFSRIMGLPRSFDGVLRRLSFHPLWNLYEWAVEPVSPLTMAPHWLADPVIEGPRPDVLCQIAGHDEFAGMAAPQQPIAAAGMPGVGTFDFAEVEPTSAPVTANVSTPGGPVTAAAWIFEAANHAMGFDYEQESRWEAPLDVPFVERPTPIVLANPVVDVHRQAAYFFRTRFETGRAVICDPAVDCPAW